MFAKLLADAVRLGVALPRSASELTAIVDRCAPALDAVRTPRLVHFDLWDGNVLVDAGATPPRVSGIIDGERAFHGDPLAEMASLALFREIESDDAFLRGYAEALGRPLAWSDPERQRIALAQLYLYLIMRIEPATRGSGGVVGFVVQRLVMRSLRRVLRKLDALTR
jgi:fructosamine-3-kinase